MNNLPNTTLESSSGLKKLIRIQPDSRINKMKGKIEILEYHVGIGIGKVCIKAANVCERDECIRRQWKLCLSTYCLGGRSNLVVTQNQQLRASNLGKVHYPIFSGITESRVLGPLLYTIFTTNLPKTEEITTTTFVEDTVLLASKNNNKILYISSC
ncbi:hypothetical protein M0802_009452 [Mischocyttarus mexicanus]|nr:hypothetical protein M0802_009452 [Mischocyttarus mexicanus]